MQQLLGSQHWPVQHAAFEALLQLVRHSSCAGSGIVLLLPPSMCRSATEATPAVIATIKAHLHKQADPEVCVCVCVCVFAPCAACWTAADRATRTADTAPIDVPRCRHPLRARATQAQQAYQQLWPHLAGQHAQQLAPLAANAHAFGAQDHALAGLQQLLAAAQAGVQPGAGSGGGAGRAARACGAAANSTGGGVGGGDAAAQAGGAPHPLLPQVNVARHGLQGVEQAIAAAEAAVQGLLAGASAAAREHTLSAGEVALLSKQGVSLAGAAASLGSRLRALQDGLSCLRS
jgi:hypothetical protein